MTDPDPNSPQPQPQPQTQQGPRMPVSFKRMAMPAGVSLQSLALAGVALLAGMIIWNLNLRNDLSDLEERLAGVESENATIRASANATVYQLLPTADAPQNANAQAWFSIQGSGVLSVANMPQLEDGMAY